MTPRESHMEQLNCDVLVLGAGAAGLRAAVEAAQEGLGVLVLCKGSPGAGTSTILSGGVFRGTLGAASPEAHMESTLEAGRGLNDPALVRALVEDSGRRLQELLDWGLPAEVRGGFLFTLGQAPVWGKPIVDCLLRRATAQGVVLMGSMLVAKILSRLGAMAVLAYDQRRGRWLGIKCKAMVLATGGAGALYLRHDNPQRMLGEGYALALEAGATLQDMEFVQFYPVGLAEPGLPPFLIPPRLADKGALTNGRGEDLLEKYGILERPAAERARDKLSQAMFAEMSRGEELWLDLRSVTEEQWLGDPLSASCRELLRGRYGAGDSPLRVAPMAHFMMGGVRVDLDGSTGVQGLFCAGEAAGGLHGANRLGGNALAEAVVFGARTGEAAALWAKDAGKTFPDRELDDSLRGIIGNGKKPPLALKELLRSLKARMWRQVGIPRNGEGLREAMAEVEKTIAEVDRTGMPGDPRQAGLWIELGLAARTAGLVLEAAWRRQESRGAHFREDFPRQEDPEWLGHIVVSKDERGQARWEFRPLNPRGEAAE